MANPLHLHFMGIGGSGMSAVAQIAAAQGHIVSGCDLQSSTPYLDKLKVNNSQITVHTGHNPSHLENIDLLCVTPAVFYQNNHHPEVETAQKRGILLTWQQFLGQYLHHDKFSINVAGTHGKSTTTALTGVLLEEAGLDPTVEVGATVNLWHNNVRLGKSQYFVSEADEFYNNFSAYNSDIILLTLLEFDHPEYFGTVDKMLLFFQQFIDHLKPGGKIIYNADSPLTSRLNFPSSSIGYHLSDYDFTKFPLTVPGNHNKSNAMAVINLAKLLNIPDSVTASALLKFTGIGRRLELLGEKNNVKVYDDYANHPSSFSASILAVKELYPKSKLWAIVEPHTYSRLRVMLSELPAAFSKTDEVIISKIFASRETDPGDFTGADIVSALHHPRAQYIPEFSDIASQIKSKTKPGDIVLVMGSGDSYKLSRQILASL
jgi:UDP-N-acetylmuramate--alanine ligase